MPIARFICKVHCGGREVPLDHFATTDCGDCHEPGVGIHPDIPAALLNRDRAHHKECKRIPGITDIVSGCPRATAIKHDVDYALDPIGSNAAMTGNAWHQYIANNSGSKDCEVAVSGLIEGKPVCGFIDRIRMERGLIEDHKHSNDFVHKYAKRDGPKPEHRAQLSLGAELVEQTMKWRPVRGTIWAHYTGSPGLYPMPVILQSLSDVLEFRPWKGSATVRDHLAAMEKWRRGEAQWSDLPLFGESQSIGDKDACFYCPVFGPCKEQARGAAF